MSVGIVIVTHGDSGAHLLEVAEFILGEPLDRIGFVAFHQSGDRVTTVNEVRQALAGADTGQGVLVLTDLIGSSPSNLVNDLLEAHRGIMVTGLNLPMLMTVWNYRGEPLKPLAHRAVDAGRRGCKVFES